MISRPDKRLIYDVGAHKGEDTEFYLKMGFDVVAIEPMAELFESLSTRFVKEVADGRLTLLNVAVSDRSGAQQFFASEKSDWGTMIPEWAARNEQFGVRNRRVTVQTERFETILEKHGIPYYLKIDIEGSDLLCLKALRPFAAKPKFVSLESNKVSFRGLLDEFELMRLLGYDRFKIINQQRVPLQTAPIPFDFQPGSSGLFGADLPGQWHSAVNAIARYIPIFARYKFFGDNTSGARLVRRAAPIVPTALRLLPPWYDTHATRMDHDESG